MFVYWLERTGSDVPALDEWLSEKELDFLRRMKFPKRKSDWRLGRWTAKQATAAYLKLHSHAQALKGIEIIAAPSGAPEVLLCGQQVPVTISLSHRAGMAMCVVTSSENQVGCDVEVIETHSDAFVADYFTNREQALVKGAAVKDRLLLVALMWSAKESALKAVQMGLRLDTRSMEVELPWPLSPEYPGDAPAHLGKEDDSMDWHRLALTGEGQVFSGWWRQAGVMVRSVVSVDSSVLLEPQLLTN
jgi:4'-phosphopantetheinyl transferase